jgi:predicted AAA+ superfamily ATPase
MIKRAILSEVIQSLEENPAVALLGPRQVGKTTLALNIGQTRPSVYLDLESQSDRTKLSEPELYLNEHIDKLVILDEVQSFPGIFEQLRGLIDRGRRQGHRSGRFLLLGSASIELLKQSGESLAGRIAYHELTPLSTLEILDKQESLWLRGGFPDSFLAKSDEKSMKWRMNFIKTYLERDIPQLGPRIAAETLRRFWTMLAHRQNTLLNASEISKSLGVDSKTVAKYLDLMVDLLLVRRLPPWHGNLGKRLVKSPKIYIRDTGLCHALLNIVNREALISHPISGLSWESFVIENLISVAPIGTMTSFYRTAAGAEIDLYMEFANGETMAIEIKRSLSPKVEKGFHIACHDLKPTSQFIVYPGSDSFLLTKDIKVISLTHLCRHLVNLSHPK